jgi:hypothetical protein
MTNLGRRAVALCFAGLVLLACRPHESSAPPAGPEASCVDGCVKRATSCDERQCTRGCRILVDRMVEREGNAVLACVARGSKQRCDESVFAECAARVGPHADGGPPPPSPPDLPD